jgi:aldehyde dehydrogenase (NAD+)
MSMKATKPRQDLAPASSEGWTQLTEKDAFKVLDSVKGQLFINNEWVDAKAGGKLDVVDPRTGETVKQVANADESDVDAAVLAARKAFDEGPWPRMGGKARGRLMHKVADLMEEHLTQLSLLESLDSGKPLSQSYLKEMPLCIDNFRYFAGWADKITGAVLPTDTPHHAYTLIEPLGVVAAITPWNFPLMEFCWKVTPALAAGNTVVIKVSKETTLTALLMGDIIKAAGLPPGVVNILTGPGSSLGDAMTQHPLVDKVTFTGSTSVGRGVGEKAGGALKAYTLELGGKSPVIVCPDVDIDKAVEVATFGLLYNMGQCCAAGTRLYVHEDIYDVFVDKYVKSFKSWKIGDPFHPDTQHGPQINHNQLEKIMKYVEEGQKNGGKLLYGGKRVGDKGYYFEPTIFEVADNDAKIAQEEIFGPVQCVFKWRDMDKVVAAANDNPYGLAAGVLAKDQRLIDGLVRRLKAGTVWVNTYNVYDAGVPFGGYKDSGIGREKSEYALRAYTQVKAVYQPLEDTAAWH